MNRKLQTANVSDGLNEMKRSELSEWLRKQGLVDLEQDGKQIRLSKNKHRVATLRLAVEKIWSKARKTDPKAPPPWTWCKGKSSEAPSGQVSDQHRAAAKCVPLTDVEVTRYEDATCPGVKKEVLVRHFASGVDLTRGSMMTLGPGTWLDDEVINMYMQLLRDRSAKGWDRNVSIFNTFFKSKLEQGKGKTKRWFKSAVSNPLASGLPTVDLILVFLPHRRKSLDFGGRGPRRAHD